MCQCQKKLWVVKYVLGILWAKERFRFGVYLALTVIVLGGFGEMSAKKARGCFFFFFPPFFPFIILVESRLKSDWISSCLKAFRLVFGSDK